MNVLPIAVETVSERQSTPVRRPALFDVTEHREFLVSGGLIFCVFGSEPNQKVVDRAFVIFTSKGTSLRVR